MKAPREVIDVTLPVAGQGSEVLRESGVVIRETDTFRWLEESGSIQSIMDRTDPSRLVLPNHQTMWVGWVIPPTVERVLNLGAGLGSFERFAELVCPNVAWTAVEVSGLIARLAREFFSLPATYPIVESDAAEFIAGFQQTVDLVFIDLFTDAQTARTLYDVTFYADLKRVLSDSGAIAMNVIPENQRDLVEILLPLRRYFDYVSLAEIENRSNVVLMASNVPQAMHSSGRQQIETAVERFNLPLPTLAKHFVALPQSATAANIFSET